MLVELLQDANKKLSLKEHENEKTSSSIAKQLLKNLIEEIPKVEDLDNDTITSELLFDNLENAILDLLSSYFETVRGPSKSKKYEVIFRQIFGRKYDPLFTHLHVRTAQKGFVQHVV